MQGLFGCKNITSETDSNFNYYVLEYPLPKKIVEYKESVIILDGGIYSPWIGFQSKEEYDYLADLSGIDWHLFFKKYWSLRFGNKISKEVIDFFDLEFSLQVQQQNRR